MCTGSQPVVVGLPENPYPGIDGITTSNASDALAPWAVGSGSGLMSFICSTIDPGQPWQTTIGSASSCLERTWTKWMSSPSISVMKLGTELSLASHVRQSYSVCQ